jgi:hypothetical protein
MVPGEPATRSADVPFRRQPGCSGLLFFGGVGAIAAIFLMSEALRQKNVRFASYYVSGLVAVVIAAMAVLRDAYVAPYYRPEQFPVKTQWSVFPLVLALFVEGVILRFVILARYGSFRDTKTAHKVEKETPVLTGTAR